MDESELIWYEQEYLKSISPRLVKLGDSCRRRGHEVSDIMPFFCTDGVVMAWCIRIIPK